MSDKVEVSDKSKKFDNSTFDKLVKGRDITLNCLIPVKKIALVNVDNNRVSSLANEKPPSRSTPRYWFEQVGFI
jgi:hypothetical protein